MLGRIDICELAKQRGAQALRFHIPVSPQQSLHRFGLPLAMVDRSAEQTIRPCVVDEERYRVADGYKIKLVPVDDSGERDPRFASETFYQMDLESIMERNENFRLEIVGLGDDIH